MSEPTSKAKINLCVEPKKSILNGIICKEPIDIDILNKLISSDLLRENFNNPFAEYNNSNELEQLLKYESLITKGFAYVQYNKVANMDYGRVHPKNSLGLFSIRREIRQTLSKNKLVDIDIVNAHPVMLLQICKQNNIEHSYLKKYVNFRSKYLEQLQKAYLASIDDSNKLKDVSKNLFIRLLYLGKALGWFKDNYIEMKDTKEYHSINKFITRFEDEMEVIAEKICEANPLLVELVKKRKNDQNKKKYNLNGAVMSYFLQEYECQILECMFNYCVKHKYIVDNVCVLCADGFMILKDKFKIELLNELENEVYNKTGFKINLSQKEMTQDYLSILDEHIVEKEDNKTYKSLKLKFEKTSFKIKYPLMYGTIHNDNLFLQERNTFINEHENIIMDDVKKSKKQIKIVQNQFIKQWLKDPDMRTYDSLDFRPQQQTPNNIFNTFLGYKAEKLNIEYDIKIEDTLIYKHLFNICGKDEGAFKYVINFLARKLQKPYKLTNTALIFKSVEGCGKDTFFNWFGQNVLGKQYYFNEEKIDDMFGKFNSVLKNKILVIINETSGKDTKLIESSIKNAITREYNSIQCKGFDPYDNLNNIGYVFLTNNDNPLKIDINDRRFQAIQSNPEIANNREYFKALREEIDGENKDKISKAFYDYLMSIDCDNFDFTSGRVRTDLYNDIKEHNKPVVISFFEDKIMKNVYRDSITKEIKIKDYKCCATKLYEEFSEYLRSNNFKFDITSTKFFLELKKFNSIVKIKTNKGSRYNINLNNLKNYFVEKQIMEWDDKDIVIIENKKKAKEEEIDPLD